MVLAIPQLTNAHILTPVAYAQEATTTARDAWLDALSQCENNQWPQRKKIVDVNGYYSYGPMMYQLSTWLGAGKDYGFKTTRANIYDQALQEAVTTAMLDDGRASAWWTCSKRVQKAMGDWPVVE